MTYVSGDVITFGWHSEGAEEYVVEIYDSNGKRAEQTTDQLALSLLDRQSDRRRNLFTGRYRGFRRTPQRIGGDELCARHTENHRGTDC